MLPAGSATAQSSPTVMPNMSALMALTATQMSGFGVIFLSGYYGGSPLGGGSFVWTPVTSATPNIGTIIAPSDAPGTCSSGCLIRVLTGPITPFMFGARGDGSTDDRSAVQAMLNTAAGTTTSSFYFPTAPGGYYRLSGKIEPMSKSELYGDGPSSAITCVDLSDDCIWGQAAVNNLNIHDLKISYEIGTVPAAHNQGAISLYGANNRVADVEVADSAYIGINLPVFTSFGNTVSNIYCHDNQAAFSLSDSACIQIANGASQNIIEGSRLTGGAGTWHGIHILNATAAHTPLHNKILHNYISGFQAYGIVDYNDGVGNGNQNTFSLIDGNTIHDIQGTALSNGSGMCIYIQTEGGATIVNNAISNCMLQTTASSLLLAAISVAGTAAYTSSAATTISDNSVQTSKFLGIGLSINSGTVAGNNVSSALGGGTAIYVTDCLNGCSVSGNTAVVSGPQRGIDVTAEDMNVTGVTVVGNVASGSTANPALHIRGANGKLISGVISGNNAIAGPGGVGGALMNVTNSIVANNSFVGGGGDGFDLTNCTNVAGSGNRFRDANHQFVSVGISSGCFFDLSNDFDFSAVTHILNNVTGVNIEIRGNSPPSAGNFQVGDRVQQSVPQLLSPKGWDNIAAGTPGNWVSEGNL